MSKGLNKVQLIGNLTQDPEFQIYENKSMRASFSIATNEIGKNKDGNPWKKTEFHKIVCWGSLAELVNKYVRKGMLVYVEGKLRTTSFDTDSGTKYSTFVEISDIIMLKNPGGKEKNQNFDLTPSNDLPF